jgi:excisionase family DNA binding protein
MNKEIHFVFDNQKSDIMQKELTQLTKAVAQINELLISLKEGQTKSEYMTEKEVAELLRKGVKYIRGLRNENRLPYYRFEGRNGSVLYKRAEVQSYIQKVLKQ